MLSTRKRNGIICITLIFCSFILMGQPIGASSKEKLTKAKVSRYVHDVAEVGNSTITENLWSYAAKVSPVSEFFDSNGNLNTIYESEQTINLLKYSADYKLTNTYTIKKLYPLYGGAICDSSGNYYIIYGKADETGEGKSVVLSVVKYNDKLEYVTEVKYIGAETNTYSGMEWGTKIPFNSGNCDIALNGNVLVFSYARTMFNGHQSNHVIYVNIDTMEKIDHAGSYTSHSFDQRVLVTKSGNYLFVDHGDAYSRGFKISSVLRGSTDIWDTKDYISFHFREGANRDYGYNETYAQLGDIAEISSGYVLAGASEKTLSIDVAPTSRKYCGYSEARNLFIQILDKNFIYLSGQDTQVLKTEVRQATGTKPSNPLTKLYLSGDEKNYGVLWLTNYSNKYSVVNPKLITTEDERIVLLWEKFQHEKESEKYVDTYYMILSSSGEVLQGETSLRGVRLTENETPIYRNNKVYWSTFDGETKYVVLNELHIGEKVEMLDISSLTHSKIKNQNLSDYVVEPKVTIKVAGKTLREGMDYSLAYKNNDEPGKATIIIRGIGDYYGEKEIYFYIKPEKPFLEYLLSEKKGSFYFCVEDDNWYPKTKYQIVYSTSSKFTNKKTVNKTDGTVSKLTSRKTYYVKARLYIIVDGVKVYSDYSKVYKVKVK